MLLAALDRRRFVATLTVGTALLALSSCAAPGAGTGPPPPPTATPASPAPPSRSPAPSAPAPSPTRATPVPTPTPTPLPPGTFLATVAVRPAAEIRSGPGTDMAVIAQEPFGTAELFDGWFSRGDDPPVADFRSGALEAWSQDWYRLANGRGWMHSSTVQGFPPGGMARVAWTPPPVRDVPVPAAGAHRIVISIQRQHLWAFDGPQLVLDTVIGTGRPELPTLLGTYHVFYKTSPYMMVSPWPYGSPYWYASARVEYVMEFISGGYFIHDAPWRTRWGPGANLAAGSHGCVNVPLPVMAQLYRWTHQGDEVVVQNR